MQDEKAHVKKHSARGKTVEPDDVRIQFAPEVVRGLSRLEAMVHNSPHYDSDLLQNLQGLTSGEPVPLQYALTEIGLITRETMKHVHATGDTRAEAALTDLHNHLMGDPNPKPFTVVVSQARVRST